jgi:phosphonate transport system substrate-binding protein
MKKLALMLIGLALLGLAGCGGKTPLVWVWYPNESTPEMASARAELIKTVSDAIGRPVEEQLTTDYNIAIEALVNKNAAFGFFGAEGYTQAHAKNPGVMPLVVNSGASGTLKDAKYFSMFGVLKQNAAPYRENGAYSIKNIIHKKFSFVSTSSTSGFRVPTSFIAATFKSVPEWANLKSDDLVEGGANKFFSEVLFGNSHQGSLLNVINQKADAGAFCNTCVANYVEWEQGSLDDPKAGDVIRIKQDAADPFNKVPGVEVTLLQTIPVLNGPVVMNVDLVSKDEIDRLVAVLCSDTVAKNEKIFVPKGSSFTGMFQQGLRFVTVEDSWYDPIRLLSGLKK